MTVVAVAVAAVVVQWLEMKTGSRRTPFMKKVKPNCVRIEMSEKGNSDFFGAPEFPLVH